MKYLMYLQLFAHAHQERWSSLVDKKLRQTLVTRDNYIFNTNYEGNPKAGKVKIPVRDTEVTVKAYNKATGVDLETGSTTYMDLDINQDMAVNELIDGYDAVSVPDNLVADRLDSAGYSLALDRLICWKLLPESKCAQLKRQAPTQQHIRIFWMLRPILEELEFRQRDVG